MSSIKMSPNASGTGIFTVAAPATNTDRTLTLPDQTGTLALQGGAGVGKVLQVVQGTLTSSTSVTSTSLVDSGLSATITPSSSSSKILVLLSQKLWVAGTNGRYDGYIVRNGTNIVYLYGGYYGSTEITDSSNVAYLDAPATTSALTYKTQFRLTGGSRYEVNANASLPATMILMEIAA